MYYLTNFHLNLKLVDIIRATKIRIIILITYKLSVNIRILNSILFITHFPYSRDQSRNRAARRSLSSAPCIKQVIPSGLSTEGDEPSEKNGDYLLSHCYAVPSA